MRNVRLRPGFVLVGLALLAPRVARAEPLRVVIERPAPRNTDAALRLVAELESEGYALSWLERDSGGSPCADTADAAALPLPAAFIRVQDEPEAQGVVAVVCYARRRRTFEQVSVSVATSDHKRLAVAVVEALHGLQAEPLGRVEEPAKPLQTPRTARAASGAAFAQAALAFEAWGGSPVVGTGLGLQTSVTEALSLQLEAFAPVRESDSRGLERELSLGASWARLGPRMAWTRSPLRFGLSLQAGAALVWASARSASPERVGGAALAASGLVASGLWLECPSSTRFYFRAGANASRLLPSINLALGDGRFLPFGQLLLDLSLGFGFRWHAGQ